MITFKLVAPEGSFDTVPLGRVAGGYRLQVTYKSKITFSGNSDFGGKRPKPVCGHVIAGNDWVLLRDDGVALFDANITFQAEQPGPHVLDARLSGRADLTQTGQTGWKKAISSTRDLMGLNATPIVTLPIQFETSAAVPAGAADVFKAAAANGGPFAELAKHQFLARGPIVIAAGQLTKAELDVFSVDDWEERSRRQVEHQVNKSLNAGLIERTKATTKKLGPILSLLVNATPGTWESDRDKLRKLLDDVHVKADLRALLGSRWNEARERSASEAMQALSALPQIEWDAAVPSIDSIFTKVDPRARGPINSSH